MSEGLKQIFNYYVQVHSPVHVGSGERLQKGLDFFSGRGQTWLVNRQMLEAQLATNPRALDDFSSQGELNIQKLAYDHRLDLDAFVSDNYEGETTSTDIFEFVRNGRGYPYLPGSSLKGALRTVILWKLSQKSAWRKEKGRLLQDVLRQRDKWSADKPVVEKAFNMAVKDRRQNDANRDLMRVLQVGDVDFSREDLGLADGRVFNVLGEKRSGWKVMSGRRNESEPRKATQLAAEALRIGTYGQVRISLDNFLLEEGLPQTEARFQEHANLFNNLAAICNEYASRQIIRQKQFFEKYNLRSLVQFYDELERLQQKLPDTDFLLRLAWGSGWQGMTGELFEDERDLGRIRKKFSLGKWHATGEMQERCPICGSDRIRPDNKREGSGFCIKGKHTFPAPGVKRALFPVFPKTRKIALEAGKPVYPFGWVIFHKEKPGSVVRKKTSQRPPRYQSATPTAASTGASIEKIQSSSQPKKISPTIKVNDKLRAKITKIERGECVARFLEKDIDRELSFKAPYMPLKAGDEIEVRVKGVNPEGTEVTKIGFVKKITR